MCSGLFFLIAGTLGSHQGSRFSWVTLAVLGRTDSRETWKLDISWMIATGTQVDRDHSWTRQGKQIQRGIGLAKKFIQLFCIRCYGKILTNLLANPILRR